MCIRDSPKPNELRIITQLLTEIKSVHEDEINELNYQTIQTVFQITRFLERELQFGSKRSKIQALKLIQSINGYASEAVLVRFLYHRELELRNSARYTYMWLSQGDVYKRQGIHSGSSRQSYLFHECITLISRRETFSFKA